MAKSLQDQLLGAGLIDKKKAKSIKKEKSQQRKQLPKGQVLIDENKERIDAIKLEKQEKDKALNKKRDDEMFKKALKAQVKQLVLSNQIKRASNADQAFQFSDNKKIKKIFVDNTQFEHLSRGILAIACIENEYILISKNVAKKIMERDEATICYYFEKEQSQIEKDEEDPYKDFVIPDDLMW